MSDKQLFSVIAKPTKSCNAISLKETSPFAIFVRNSGCFSSSSIPYSESETFYTRTNLYNMLALVVIMFTKWLKSHSSN